MFSGIVETTGKIIECHTSKGCLALRIMPHHPFTDVSIGDSIAINGVCLTVTQIDHGSFTFTAVPETLRLTNLGQLTQDSLVNMERSITLNTRIGGHHVQGHVDSIGHITELHQDAASAALLAKISIPAALTRYIVPKGYITLDGMSITVIEVAADWFSVTFIPHTQHATIVNHYQVNTAINIEVDMMGKYIERLLGGYQHVNTH